MNRNDSGSKTFDQARKGGEVRGFLEVGAERRDPGGESSLSHGTLHGELAVTIGLVLIVVLPRVREFGSSARTTVERRSGGDRRKRLRPMPVEQRRCGRRAEDVAREYVAGLFT